MTMARARILLRHPAGWIATGLGSGLSPMAPGTVGSLVAIGPWLWLRGLPIPLYLAVVLVGFLLGVWAANWTIRRIGREDPGLVVIDEFVGLWIALVAVPDGWIWLLTGFALFRLFDITKPWPAGWADRTIKGGLGTMLDDVIAGLYALALVQAAAWWLIH